MRQVLPSRIPWLLAMAVVALVVTVAPAQGASPNGLGLTWGSNANGQLGTDMPIAVDTAGVLSGKTVTDSSAGGEHSCAIADSAVFCWGNNQYGQLGNGQTTRSLIPVAVNTSGVLAGRTVTSVSAGENHTCAIADGAAYCWGSNNQGQLGNNGGPFDDYSSPVAVNTAGALSGKTVTSISAGSNRTCAIAYSTGPSDSAAYCWGNNNAGQLGDNSTTQRKTPVAVTASDPGLADKTVTDISTGGTHTCAVADGAAYCWGYNGNGQLGDNSTTQSHVPVAVDTAGVLLGRTVTDISAGGTHSCAVADEAAYCWGWNEYGQLGDNSTTESHVPVAVDTAGELLGRTVTDISTGGTHSCVVADEAAFCWGDNDRGQLGTNDATPSTVPIAVNTSGVLAGKAVDTISSLNNNSCAVADGAAYCWSDNSNGQLGLLTPVAVDTVGVLAGKTMSSISAGSNHTCAVADGAAYCWGKNENGELGDGSDAQSWTPVAVDASGVLAGKTVTSISAGDSSSCAIADGAAYCWGDNDRGQLGNDSTTRSLVPVPVDTSDVLAGKTLTDISVGGQYTCAVAGGSAYCWGKNDTGQLGDDSTTQRQVPVAVDTAGVLAGKAVTEVSAGYDHTCAIADDAAYCWGSNFSGQLGDNSTDDRHAPVAVDASGLLAGKAVTSVSPGLYFSCAIASGAAYCWGGNGDGQLGTTGVDDPSLSPVAVQASDPSDELFGKAVSSLSAGAFFSCVVAGGSAYCWGNNDRGQLGDNATQASWTPIAVNTTGDMAGKTVTGISAGYESVAAVAEAEATVRFQPNGGTGSMPDQASLLPAALNANTFTRTGYSFDRWTTQADGGGDSYANRATFPFTADATLYAQWTANVAPMPTPTPTPTPTATPTPTPTTSPTPTGSAPGPVTGIRTTPVDAGIVVAWDSTPGADGYTATASRMTGADLRSTAKRSCTTAELTCTITGLRNGVAYEVTVVAFNEYGAGPVSSDPDPVTPTAASVKLRVKASKKGTIRPDERSRLVRSATSSNGTITRAKLRCELYGKPLTGAAKQLACKPRITLRTIKGATSSNWVRMSVKPTCSVGLRVRASITAEATGRTPAKWQRTWRVGRSPRSTCTANGNG